MKTTPLLLFIPLLMTSGALASGQDDFNVQTASSRMVKHEDGSRSYFEKTGDGKGMKKNHLQHPQCPRFRNPVQKRAFWRAALLPDL